MMNLPQHVEIVEVGPRDGFQNLKNWVPTDVKLKVIDGLVDSGFTKMEMTSFVHPQAVPQMADAAEVLTAVKQKYRAKLTTIALVPNLFGARKAIEIGADEMTFVISASERHNQENTRQTPAQSVAALDEVAKIKGRVKLRLAIATAFDCPFIGPVPFDNVLRLVEAGLSAGADEFVFADTIGTADPLKVEFLINEINRRYPQIAIKFHIHDTHGMGLANTLTALNMGVTYFETAVGGLGGCPFAPGAAGNIATEDMVNMLHKMGISTGVNLEKLVNVAKFVSNSLLIPLINSHIASSHSKERCAL